MLPNHLAEKRTPVWKAAKWTVHLMAWERAKGDLRSMLATRGGAPSITDDRETVARPALAKRLEAFVSGLERDL